MKYKILLTLCVSSAVLSLVGCKKEMTINDVQQVEKTQMTETNKEEITNEIEVEIVEPSKKEEVKDDYSWASYETVTQAFDGIIDSSYIDFYIAASQHVWANASPNFKLDIGKNDSYFWNTLGYANYNEFLADYYTKIGFHDVPDYVVNSMSEVSTYEMVWNALLQDWSRTEPIYQKEGLGLGFYVRRLKLPSVKTAMFGSNSIEDPAYITYNEFSNEVCSNYTWVQAGKYGENGGTFAVISQRYAYNLGLTDDTDKIGVNYPYVDRDDGGVYLNLDVNEDGIPEYRSLITAGYMKSKMENPAGFLYVETDDKLDMIDKMNAFVETNALTNFDGLLSDIMSGVNGIYTYPYGYPEQSNELLEMTQLVKSRLEKSAGKGTQGSAIASYIYYWKDLYASNNVENNNVKTIGGNDMDIVGEN